MNRITVNLARRPPENLRQVRLLWGSLLGVLLAAFIVLSAIALTGWLGSRGLQAQVSNLRGQMSPLLASRARSEAPLHRPDVRQVLDRADYFNQLIDRKTVSWTRLFERLEQIQPQGVALVSLRPLQRNGARAIDIRFTSDTLAPAIDFVRRLELSGDFADAQVERETEAVRKGTTAGAPAPPRFQIEVTALYHPRAQVRAEGAP